MKSFIMALAIAFMTVPLIAADTITDDDARIKQLGNSDHDIRVKAADALVEAGPAAVPVLIGVFDRDKQNGHKMAEHALFRMAYKAAGSPQQNDVAKALAGELKTKRSPVTRGTICKLLSFVGTDDSVEALADALDDPEARDMARWALIRIPGEKALHVLVEHLNTEDAAWHVSVINALAQKADPKAVTALAEDSNSSNEIIRVAALEALARTPSKESLKALREALSKPEGSKNLGGLLLQASDTLMNAGLMEEGEEALTISMMANLAENEAQQCQQMLGLGRVGSGDAGMLLLDDMDKKSPRVKAATFQACLLLKGESATTTIARQMAGSPPPDKAAFLDVLGQRGGTMSAEAGELIAKAIADSDDSVRLAAIVAAEKAGIESCVEALVKALEAAPGPIRDAAEHALSQAPGGAITKKIAEAAGGNVPAAIRLTLLSALGQRHDTAALPVLADASKDKEVAVRTAALAAIGVLQSPEGADILIERLKGEAGPDIEVTVKALAHLRGDEVTTKLLDAYRSFPDAKKPALLRAVGHRKNAQVVELLAKESKSDNQEIRAAALAGMGYQDDPKAAPVLLEAAKQGPASVTEPAITGYLHAAKQTEEKDRNTAGTMYSEAMKLAVTDDQKQQALEGLDRTGAAKDVALLPFVRPLMNQGNARMQAAKIAAELALTLHDDRKQEIVEVLTAAVKMSPGDEVGTKALARLRDLGVNLDPARDAGFIMDWWVIGPFPNPNEAMWEKGFFPEEQVDLQTSKNVDNVTYSWKKYHSPMYSGAVDMEKAVAAKEEVGAYAYTEVVSDKDQDVVFKMGSDDAIVVWLNGQKVHANHAARPLHIDEDQVKVRLRTGVNKILCKILNGGASWGFSFRATTTTGDPIILKPNAG